MQSLASASRLAEPPPAASPQLGRWICQQGLRSARMRCPLLVLAAASAAAAMLLLLLLLRRRLLFRFCVWSHLVLVLILLELATYYIYHAVSGPGKQPS